MRERCKHYIVRLRSSNLTGDNIDHCIVIDGRRGCIIDPEEKKLLTMTVQTLWECVCRLDCISECRRVVLNDHWRRKRKNRRGVN